MRVWMCIRLYWSILKTQKAFMLFIFNCYRCNTVVQLIFYIGPWYPVRLYFRPYIMIFKRIILVNWEALDFVEKKQYSPLGPCAERNTLRQDEIPWNSFYTVGSQRFLPQVGHNIILFKLTYYYDLYNKIKINIYINIILYTFLSYYYIIICLPNNICLFYCCGKTGLIEL